MSIPAYWLPCKGGRNFGDALTAVLWRRLFDTEVRLAGKTEARLWGVGSVLGHLPPGYDGWVWGTGLMWGDRAVTDLRRVQQPVALRGPLTAGRCLLPEGADLVFGDAGLLCNLLLPWVGDYEPAEFEVGTIRHYVDDRPPFGHPIDVLAPPGEVIRQTARCQSIISSSLHGIILADSLGLPSMWWPHPGVKGDGFKFRDHGEAVGVPVPPNRWRDAPPPARVKALQKGLLHVAAAARAALR